MLSYEEFTDAERELWDAFPEGRLVELRSGAADSDGEQGEQPEPETEVRAAVLTALLLGGNPGQLGAIAALRVSGARITGRLDLAGAQIEHKFRLEKCSFDEPPSLYEAVTRTVAVVDCRLPALDAGNGPDRRPTRSAAVHHQRQAVSEERPRDRRPGADRCIVVGTRGLGSVRRRPGNGGRDVLP
ncbi:hypothetical protein [Streptomyces sp. NBC_00191]|uniref:hypothetical protein n=1 Tax=Streptomyces sp. NBC_00191 TaxID=2975674 RepID=UPI0038668389